MDNQDLDLIGGAETGLSISLQSDEKTLLMLHQHFSEDYKAGRGSRLLTEILNNARLLPSGQLEYWTPTYYIPSTQDELQAGLLASQLQGFVENFDLQPATKEQEIYFRLLSDYEFFQGLVLFHRMFGTIEDPLKDGLDVIEWLRGEKLRRFLLEINVGVALWNLMTAGEAKIRSFLAEEKIESPFTTTLEMFVDGVRQTIEDHLNAVICPNARSEQKGHSKKQRKSLKKQARDNERSFRKFLNQDDLPKQLEDEYIQQLRTGGWFDLTLLALRQDRYGDLEQQWNAYIDARRKAEEIFVTKKEYWDEEGVLWRREDRNSRKRIRFQWEEGGKLRTYKY